MAGKVSLEIAGIVENMAGFTTPSGERFAIFGEGGGQALADEIDVPLLGKIPLTMPLREQADAGTPLVFTDPDDPAAQAIRADRRRRTLSEGFRAGRRSCYAFAVTLGRPASVAAGTSTRRPVSTW